MCFAPAIPSGPNAHPGTILIANDADDPPYITFIATDGPKRMQILEQIQFSNASAGIEQCQFDPNANGGVGLFYLNLPEDSTAGGEGAVVTFEPVTLAEIDSINIGKDFCVHPQGMAIDFKNFNPSHVLLGCNGATTGGTLDSLIITGSTFTIVQRLLNQGSADEVWFEPISHHFFLAEGRCGSDCGSATNNVSPPTNNQGIQTLGIIDSTAINSSDPFFGGQNLFIAFQGRTTRNAHSVAAWSGALGTLGNFTIAFVPVPASGGAAPGFAPYSSTLCGPFATTGCIGMVAVSPIPGGPEF